MTADANATRARGEGDGELSFCVFSATRLKVVFE